VQVTPLVQLSMVVQSEQVASALALQAIAANCPLAQVVHAKQASPLKQ
jgi:hypothetical protein